MSDNHTNGGAREAFIGVDVGGTHTDVAVMYRGTVERGKALTTYDDFSRGVLEAVEVAAEQLRHRHGRAARQHAALHQRHDRRHQRDHPAARLARRRADHERLPRRLPPRRRPAHDGDRRSPAAQRPRPRRPPRDRRDRRADRLVGHGPRPDRPRAGQGARPRRLVEEVGIDAIAICFLWSHANARARARGRGGDQGAVPGPLRDPVAPGLPGRGRDAALDDGDPQLVRPGRRRRVPDVAEREAARRRARRAASPSSRASAAASASTRRGPYPLGLLGSGPAGGAIGANELAKRMGKKRVLLGDMGGTSFDTGIIVDNEIHIDKNLELGPFMTGVNLVDVVSVGAGGGSIGWVSERGVPQVGPQSAGSTPGPAALGSRRHRADGHRRDGDARLHRPRQLPRRPRRS